MQNIVEINSFEVQESTLHSASSAKYNVDSVSVQCCNIVKSVLYQCCIILVSVVIVSSMKYNAGRVLSDEVIACHYNCTAVNITLKVEHCSVVK